MSPAPTRAYEIRIRAHDGAEVHVRGAMYLGGEGTDVTLVDQLTPLDVVGQASLVSGIVQAVEPGVRLNVEVLAAEPEETMRVVMGATGRTILLGDERPRERRFIRAM